MRESIIMKVIEYRCGDWGENYSKVVEFGGWCVSEGESIINKDISGYGWSKEDMESVDVVVRMDNKGFMSGSESEYSEFDVSWFNIDMVKGKIFKFGDEWIGCREVSESDVVGVEWVEMGEWCDEMVGDEFVIDYKGEYIKFK